MPDEATVRMAERVLECIVALSRASIMTDAIIMHPDDHAALTDDSPGKTMLWGRPIIVSSKAIQGKPMVATWGMPRSEAHYGL